MIRMSPDAPPSSVTTTAAGEASSPAEGRIVVAVDGSDATAAAFAWAADEALCRGMPVRVVTAYADAGSRPRLRRIEEAMCCQRQMYQQVRRDRPWLEEIEQVVGRGSLRALLAKATGPADLLVLGGSDAFLAGELLGHVRCPVIVVPAAVAVLKPSRERRLSRSYAAQPAMIMAVD